MKIDGDQIYFTQKMMKIRQALIGWESKLFDLIKLSNKLKEKLYYIFQQLYQKTKNDIYQYYCMIFKDKEYSLMLGGINILAHKYNFLIPIEITGNSIYKLFNRCVGDTAIWMPVSSRKYIFNTTHLCETIQLPKLHYAVGFCWVYLGPVKCGQKYDENILSYYTLQEIRDKKWEELITLKSFHNNLKIQNDYLYQTYTDIGKSWWNTDIKYITEQYYKKYFPSILDYYNNNKSVR